jgi:hypothetical protein
VWKFTADGEIMKWKNILTNNEKNIVVKLLQQLVKLSKNVAEKPYWTWNMIMKYYASSMCIYQLKITHKNKIKMLKN